MAWPPMATSSGHRFSKRIRLPRRFTGRELRPVPDGIAQLPEPRQGGVFEDGFVEAYGVWRTAKMTAKIQKPVENSDLRTSTARNNRAAKFIAKMPP